MEACGVCTEINGSGQRRMVAVREIFFPDSSLLYWIEARGLMAINDKDSYQLHLPMTCHGFCLLFCTW